jgi:hypothetical protein
MFDKYVFNKLISKAAQSKVRCRVAALALSSSGGILAYENNRHFFGSKIKFTVHAEEGLINKLNRMRTFERERNKVTIIVLRLGKYGELRNAKPCPYCAYILSRYINRINLYYTIEGGKMERGLYV